MADQEQTRFRSFAERYVIERASGFKSDTDAWTAVQEARRVYRMIEQQSVRVSHQVGVGQQALQTFPWAALGSPEWVQANHDMMVHKAMQGLTTSSPPTSPPGLAGSPGSPDKKSRVRQLFNWT
jgi:hypothetical protein